MADPVLVDVMTIAQKAARNTFSIYQQIAMATVPFALALGASREVTFTTLSAIQPGADPELIIDGNGRITIPDTAAGIWSPTVLVDCTLGGLVEVTLTVYDAAGAVVGTYPTTGFPAKRQNSLIVGSSVGFGPFRVIPHLAGSGAYTIRCSVKALVAVQVSQVEIGMLKLLA